LTGALEDVEIKNKTKKYKEFHLTNRKEKEKKSTKA
jgi:hypothetical protein